VGVAAAATAAAAAAAAALDETMVFARIVLTPA